MVASNAKNSDDYESDDFDEGENKGQKHKEEVNAHEYFMEEEARKSRKNTPVGGNPNSDGGSVFNQTGGQFLARGQFNQTKSSLFKQDNQMVPSNSRNEGAPGYHGFSNPNSQLSSSIINDKKGKFHAQNIAQNSSQAPSSSKRYDPYEEEDDQLDDIQREHFSSIKPAQPTNTIKAKE